ncbi:MAG: hypothetical protein CBC55_02850 [Gammaproteobacteria bacterium TMED95]|nr:MAG: hypothetical protein CBC55_02850 [Gammaproteobacteria bacterium TMED95]|tara:strand:- start:8443 stop:8940 length:498 start_codon:yes stop_codon:yes gene_type:complete
MTYEDLNSAVLTVSSEIEEMAKVTLSAEQRQRLNDVVTQFLESEGIEVSDGDDASVVTNETQMKSDSDNDMGNVKVPKFEMHALYSSKWEEGIATSNAVIDTESGSLVKIDVSEDGEDYETLITEEVQVRLGDTYYDFECEGGEMTDDERARFLQLLRVHMGIAQ